MDHEGYSEVDRDALAELYRRLDRDYVSVAELALWLAGVVLVLIGLHLGLRYLGRPGPGEVVSKPISKEHIQIWVASLPHRGYAVAQIPTDSATTAAFIDKQLAPVYGQKVSSYWLSLYRFAGKAADEVAEESWQGLTATAHIGTHSEQALDPPEKTSPAMRVVLAPLSAPVVLRLGHETRVQLVFPEHDRSKLDRIVLRWKGGSVELTPVERALKSLQDFRRQPTPEFFQSVHADKGRGSAK